MNQLLDNLKNDTFCRLRPDEYGGVGVFAIKDIPKDVNPFYTTKGLICPRIINVPDKEIQKLDPGVKKMIKDFFVKDKHDKWGLSFLGLNSMDITFYINHSDKPNMNIVADSSCSMLSFVTKRKINEGEQLFIDYKEYD